MWGLSVTLTVRIPRPTDVHITLVISFRVVTELSELPRVREDACKTLNEHFNAVTHHNCAERREVIGASICLEL